MDFDSYQKFTRSTRLKEFSKLYYAVGMAGETGEVCEKIKKEHRDGTDVSEGVKKELGDVLWYLSSLADSYNLPLSAIAKANIHKLNSRKKRDVIRGSGDTR